MLVYFNNKKRTFWIITLLFAFLMNVFSYTFAAELPDLPELPEFESVNSLDGLDVFAPLSVPSEVAPQTPKTVVKTTTQTTSANATQKTVQKTQPVTTKTTVTKSTNNAKTVQTKTGTTITKVQNNQKNVQTPVKTINNAYYKNNQKSFVVPSGKKFKVTLSTTISSNTPAGTKISFKSIYPETSRYITIPAGTVFYGKITDSHKPQLTGNGGLIVIRVSQMVYKGYAYPIDATISVADGKNIFFNNIKGKRMYLRSIPKALKPGTNYFKKMWKVTKKLARNESGVEIILTPFSFLAGSVVYVANFVASPVMAIFYKGKSITIPAGSQFTIKLREDAVLTR